MGQGARVQTSLFVIVNLSCPLIKEVIGHSRQELLVVLDSFVRISPSNKTLDVKNGVLRVESSLFVKTRTSQKMFE
jgi:hypothetical protein